jgi:hypothetical protein
MFPCSFELNDKPMSTFKTVGLGFPAFSGLGESVNRRARACVQGVGPIPPGSYYIFDREVGGLLGPFRDLFTGRTDWFALYSIDGRIDDETLCDSVKRGSFRLHPKGTLGRSEGCVVIDKPADFMQLRAVLKSIRPTPIPGSKLSAYGTLVVS